LPRFHSRSVSEAAILHLIEWSEFWGTLHPSENTILVCIVVDEQGSARAVLDAEGISYTEGEVVQVQLPHGPGGLAQAASKLGDANINVHYAYCGVEPKTNAPLVIFGVTEVGRAAIILDQSAAAAAGA